MAFHDKTTASVRGNIMAYSDIGLVFSPESQTTLAYNALYEIPNHYAMQGKPPTPAPQRAGKSDVTVAPGFVSVEKSDYRLRQDSLLQNMGDFPYLGAYPPLSLPQ